MSCGRAEIYVCIKMDDDNKNIIIGELAWIGILSINPIGGKE
jgi:hypothetical protein